MYTVTMLPADPVSEKADEKAVDFVVSFFGRLEEKVAKVRVHQDGVGMKVFFLGDRVQQPTAFWMYGDMARGLMNAMKQAFDFVDARHRVPPTQAELDKFIGPELRKTLTHNRDATVAFLEIAQWRKRDGGGVEIRYNDKWLHLCRTDLKDDVGTWHQWASDGDVNSLSFYFKGTVAYGSRVTDDAFYIVDSYSDG